MKYVAAEHQNWLFPQWTHLIRTDDTRIVSMSEEYRQIVRIEEGRQY